MTKKATPAQKESPGVLKIASVKNVSPEDYAALEARLADLQEQLDISEAGRSAAESAALAAAEAQGMLLQSEIQEVPTGKKVTMEKCVGYKRVGFEHGRAILEPKFATVEEPTYFYRIDMPAVGGTELVTNGVPMYHGAVVEVDIGTLRDLKEKIYRLWDHDRNISGSNENAYRRKREDTLSMRR